MVPNWSMAILFFKGKDTEITQPYPDVLGIDYLFYQSLGHPASFIQKELFKNTPYSEDLKIVSDWEFFLQKNHYREGLIPPYRSDHQCF